MIKNFSDFLIEEEREVYFTFGRMNPPTIGHGKVMDTLAKKSGKYDYKVYMSQSQNAKKDPLSYQDKVKHVRKMFPKHARQVMLDKDVKNVFDVAVKLYDQGYTKITMVVGADRIREFEVLLGKYNGTKARHGFYKFKSINVISAGARDPDATGVEGMSASKQRANAEKNDFVAFSQGVPTSMSNKDARKLFNDVRKGMGLKEERQFKQHIELEPVSETREQYVQGDLYQVDDLIIIKESGICAKVCVLGANYVIVESQDGTKMRKWLDDIEPIVEKKIQEYGGPKISRAAYLKKGKEYHGESNSANQDPDIKDRKGTQPANYHKGLKKSTKVKRDAHFKKHGKKADNDPTAYKPAPGDARAKTKPSKYTKQFKQMFDENDPCWSGYKQVGMKTGRNGNQVPNCVKEDLDEDFRSWAQSIARLKSKTIGKDKYAKVAKFVATQMKGSKKSPEFHAAEVIRKYNIDGMNARAVVDTMRDMKLVKEKVDPVATARASIDREKESDRKKHDRILDRARLARAKQKNRETK